MHLLRCLSFFIGHFDIYITATHLPGVINVTTDHLSCSNKRQTLQVNPTLMQHPTMVPPPAFELISPSRIDWTSSHFLPIVSTNVIIPLIAYV